MENQVNEKIKALINLVYGKTFSEAHLHMLLENIEKAASVITERRKMGWDEKDIVLITYADQFSAKGEKALPVFTRFYNKWLSHSFSHVHLLPFYPWSSDDGFSVIDYHEVAPETGTWRDVAELKQTTSLMFDFVCNHMSAKSAWFANYLKQMPGYDDFFISVDPETDLSAVTRPRALPLLTPFTLHDGSVRHLWTTFSEDQIDLNFASPQVLIAMVDVLLHYLIEGTVIITETNVPHKDNVSYFGNGENEAQMVYQFSLPPLVLHAVHSQDVSTLSQWAASLALPSTKTTWFNFLASHDGIGLNPLRGILPESEILSLVEKLQTEGALVNWKNNPDGTRSPYEINVTYLDALSTRESHDSERIARFILAHAVLLSFPGVPAVYIQSILGSRNDYDGVERLGYNRAINREKYAAGQIDCALEDKNSLRYQVYSALSQLIVLRRAEKAFHPDSEAYFSTSGKHVLKIVRVADCGEKITALFNFSDNSQTVESDIHSGRELISGKDITDTTLILNPWQVLWIKEN